jgi:hypothetical protein
MTASMTVPNRGQTLSSIISSVKSALGSSATLDVGIGSNEVPLNAYLGALAYTNADELSLSYSQITDVPVDFSPATSVTSVSLGTGNKTFTIQAARSLTIGMSVKVALTSNPSTWMHGDVTAYNPVTGVLSVNVNMFNGQGTYAAWTISLSAPPMPLLGQLASGEEIDISATHALAIASTTAIPVANATAPGGIKLGFSQTGLHYAVTLNEALQAYVHVPWSDTTYSLSAGVAKGTVVFTASDGTAQTISIPGLESAAYTRADTYVQKWEAGALAYRNTIDYSEVTGTPVIPVQEKADWEQVATDQLSYIQNKPKLATIATSGKYTDLLDKPDLSVYAEEWKLGALAYENADDLQIDYEQIINVPVDFSPATSTTSLTLGTGVKTLTIQQARSLTVGMSVKLALTSSPTVWMHGDVTAYNATTGSLSVDVNIYNGQGTHSGWTVSLSAPPMPILGLLASGDEIDISATRALAIASTTAIPVANTVAPGGIKIGFAATGVQYGVQLDAELKAYVQVPWTNTTYSFASGTTDGAFTVTPSGASPLSIQIAGLKSAAYTLSSDYAKAEHSHEVYVEKWALGGLAYRDTIDYAEVSNTPAPQVNADWNSVATDSPARILNKPSLATIATSGLYADLQGTPDLSVYAKRWEIGALAYRDNIDYSEISNTPTIPAAQVQSDWSAASTDAISYIKNKPILGTAASRNIGTTSGQIPVLDANGKLVTSILPGMALTSVTPVATVAAMNALTGVESGDVAVVADVRKSYVYNGSGWTELLTPTDAVTSVAGKTGVVTLTKSDVGLHLVDNTSDVGKPLSTAMIAALSAKQDIWALGALAYRDWIDYAELTNSPTKLSSFTNDSSFLTAATLTTDVLPSIPPSKLQTLTTDKLPTIPVSKLATLTTDVIPSLPTSKVTGLGTAATKNIPASGDAGTTEVVLGSDSRLVKPVDVSWAFGAMAYRDTIEYSELSGQPTIPAAQVQSDWNATSTSDLTYIKNKPTLGTAASKNTGTGGGNVPLLDSLGKLSSSVIPFGITSSSVAYGNHTHTIYAAVDHTHTGYLSAVPTAADTVTGGVRTGYTESGTTYAVKLDANSKAYVNVPLASHSHTEYSSTYHSHSSFSNDLLINSLTCGRGNGNSTSNVAFGYNCFKANSGTHNIAIGNEALKNNTTGTRNTAVGSQTFGSLTATSDNTGIGYGALNGTTGTENTCVGSYAGYLTTSGGYNTVIGSKAFYTNTAGYGNTILGASAGNALTSNFNVILGYKAAEFLGASDNNTIVGYNTAQNLVNGTQNTVIGSRINTGNVSNHVFIGDGGGNIRAKHDGTDWIMNGRVYATGFSFNSSNMLLGSGAGNSITANAARNVAIGQDALRANVQGSGNVAIGSNALYASGGGSNISIGENSLNKYTGSTSIAIGAYALQENICDIGNIAIGYESLKMAKVRNAITGLISVTTGSTIVTGHSTLFLSELSVNAFIGTTSGYFLGQIGSIQSNTQLTLKSVSNYTLSFVGLNNPNVVFAYNLAIGNYSGNRISTGTNNFIIGSNSGKSLTTENNNLIIGSNTSTDNSGNYGIVNVGGSTGGGNTVIGSDLLNNIKISTNNNVFIGSNGTIRARYYGDTSKWEFIGPIQKLRQAHNSGVLITSGAIELDCSVYQSFWVHRTANITSINIINAQGPEFIIRIYFQSDSAGTLRTVSWPSSFRWMNATADTLTQTANRVDIMELSTLNNGGTWYVLRNRQNVSL